MNEPCRSKHFARNFRKPFSILSVPTVPSTMAMSSIGYGITCRIRNWARQLQHSKQVKASTLGHQIRSYKKSPKKSPISARGPLSNNVFPKFMQDPTTPSKGTLLHQVPFPAMENYFAVLTRIGTDSATSSRNIVLEFWSSENFIQNTSQMVASAAEEERAVVAPTNATRQATNTRHRLWRNKMRNCK
jgi:hypothetical protein